MRNGRSRGCLVHLMATRRPLLRGLVWFLCFQVALNSLGLSLLLAAEPTAVAGSGTEVTKVGDLVTDVRTGTIRGTNAFNDFQTFGVDAGHTVNLHLPLTAAGAQTENLFNVVRQGQATVHGVLNAIKANKAVGGNVYFACPGGFVVGADGVVNVGSLSVATPTLAWSEDLLKGTNGDANASSWVRDGSVGRVNLVPDGLISIKGTLNAMGAISLNAGSIDVAGRLLSGAQFAGEGVDFSDVVNIGGLSGNPGDIRLVAEGGPSVSLTLGAGAVVEGKNVSLVSTVESDSVNPLNAISATMDVEGAEVTATGALTLSAAARHAPDMNRDVTASRTTTAAVRVSDSALNAGGDLIVSSVASAEIQMKRLPLASTALVSMGKASTSSESLVTGSSILTAGGDLSVASHAQTRAFAAPEIGDASPDSGVSLPMAATFSLTDITNTSTARIAGTTAVSTPRALLVEAKGLTDVRTVADGMLNQGGGGAASLALSFVHQDVMAELAEDAIVAESGNLKVSAAGETTQATLAQASVKGGDSPLVTLLGDTGALTEGQVGDLNELLTKVSTCVGSSPDSLQAAGGFALADTEHRVTAQVTTAGGVQSTRDVTVESQSLAHVDTLASGMTSGGEGGVGAAVAISTGNIENRAALDAPVNAGGDISVAAIGDDPDQGFSTRAFSGQGAGSVGLAGALAIHDVKTRTEAVAGSRAKVSALSLDVSARSVTSHGALAHGAMTDADRAEVKTIFHTVNDELNDGPAMGVGASVALNFADNGTRAALEDGAVVTVSGALGVTASSDNSNRTTAVSGAAGGISIVPVLALSATRDTTEAVIAAGSGSVHGGDLALASSHGNRNETRTQGDADGGGTAAVGLSAAVAITEDVSTAAVDRSVTATGTVGVAADSAVSVSSEAKASAGGGAEDDATDGHGLNDKVAQLFALKDAMTELGDATSKEASTSEGGVSVAAAVGVTHAESLSTARIGAGATVSAEGAVALDSRSQLDVAVIGDGSAVSEGAAIGAGVAVNVAHQKALTQIVPGAVVNAGSLALSARTGAGLTAEDERNDFSATATAGAGSSSLAIAGSVAINVVDNTTEAVAGGTLGVDGTISVSSDNRSDAAAAAGVTTEGDEGAGVGAAFATNQVTNRSLARLGGDAQMTKRSGLSLTATSATAQTATAVAGRDVFGGLFDASTEMKNVALDAAVALNGDSNVTRAEIEAAGGGALQTGTVNLTAEADDSNTVTAKGSAGGSAAVGASVAVNLNNAATEAGVARDLDVAGGLIASAVRRTSDAVEARATAMGLSVMRYISKLKGLFSEDEILAGQGGTEALCTSGQVLASYKAQTGKGGISVAAAVGVNDVNDSTRSGLAGGVNLNATGDVALTATETSTYETLGSGVAVSGGAGIGVGVAIANLGKTAEAFLGPSAGVQAKGNLTVTAEANRNAGSADLDRVAAQALAGAGAGKIGVAGSLALVTAANTTAASIGEGEVTAKGVRVTAHDKERLAARGMAGAVAASPSGVGVGAGFAVVNAGSTTAASVAGKMTADSLSLSAARSRVADIPAFGEFSEATLGNHLRASNHFAEAGAGSAGGAMAGSGAYAVNHVTEVTRATVAEGAQVTTAGDASVDAVNRSTTRTFAGALGVSGGVGVGVSNATTVMGAETGACVGAGAVVDAGRNLAVRSVFDNDLGAGSVSAGAAVAAGISGTTTVTTLANKTRAVTGDGVRLAAGGNLTLSGRTEASLAHVAGSAAVGGAVGVGGAVSVMAMGNTTEALVGAGNALDAEKRLAVNAHAVEQAQSLAASGALGEGAGVAGAVTVTSLKSTTTASLGENTRVNASKRGAEQDVALSAVHDATLVVRGGSTAGGVAAGAGVSVDVTLVRGTTAVAVGNGVEISAGRHLSLGASSDHDVTSSAVAAAGAGFAGVSGATSLVLMGEAVGDDTKGAMGDGKIADFLRDQASDIAGAVSAEFAVSGDGAGLVTEAATGTDVTMHAGGDLDMRSEDHTRVRASSGALAGAAVGVGGGMALVGVGNTTRTRTGARNTLTAGGGLSLSADFEGTAASFAQANAVALVGKTGATATTGVSSTVTAEVGDGTLSGASALNAAGDACIAAGNVVHASSEASGKLLSGVAKGSTTATTDVSAITTGRLGTYGRLEAGGSARVAADTLVDAGAKNTGGQGGLIGAGGALTTVTVSNTTLAEVDDHASVTAADTATIEALSDITAVGTGILGSAGLATKNVVDTTVTVDSSSTKARVGTGARVDAGTVNLTATTSRLFVSANATSESAAGDTTSSASATTDVTADADVVVAAHAAVTGDEAIVVRALQENMVVESLAKATSVGFTGVVEADAKTDADVNASVTLTAGADLYTSSLDVVTASTLSDADFTKDADARGKTLVRLVTKTVEKVTNVVSKIPFVGKLIKKVVTWVTEVIEEELHSAENASVSGSRTHGGSIDMDADVHLLGTANPELVIDEHGAIETQTAVSVTKDDVGNFAVGDMVNDKIGKVRLSAMDGEVSGDGTIYLKNTYDTVTVRNKSDKQVSLGLIQVAGDPDGDPNVEVIATNSHNFKVLPESTTGCKVSITSEQAGDVVLTRLIDNEYGSVDISSTFGDVVMTGGGEVRATDLTVHAGGDIGGADGAFQAVTHAGVIRAEAGGNLHMALARYDDGENVGEGVFSMASKAMVERLVAAGDLNLTLEDGTTSLGAPAEEEGEATPKGHAAYLVGTLEGGGDVSVRANNHADFTADRIASTSGSVTVSVPNGSYAVGQVEAKAGTATLAVRDAITDAGADGAWNVRAKDFHLTSATAGIGGAEALKVVQTGAGGALSASAHGKVHLAAVENDLAFGEVTATGPIEVTGKGSLGDANGAGVNLMAGEIALASETGAVNLDVNSDKLTLAAATGIDVEETDGDLNFTRAVSEAGTVRLVAAENLVDIDADEEVDVAGDRAELVAKNGHIGSADRKIRIAAAQGAMDATGDVHVIADGDLALDGVTAAGLVDLAVAGNLSDHNGEAVNISAGRVVLTVGEGLDTDTISGTVDVTAHGDVHLEETEGDLVLASVKADGDVTLGARKGDILGRAEGADVEGARVTLKAAGAVGASDDAFILDSHGVVDMTAGESINVEEREGALTAGTLTAGTAIHLKADSLTNDGDAETRISGDSLVIETQGRVEADTRVGAVEVRVASAGDVTLREADGLVVHGITLADGDADLEAGGDILAGGNAPHITARDMRLASRGGAIGADDARIVLDSTGTVSLEAQKGLYVNEADGLVINTMKSHEGAADVVVGTGDLGVTTASAAGTLRLAAKTGNLAVDHALADAVALDASGDVIMNTGSSRTMALTAGKSMTVTTATATESLTATAGTDMTAEGLTAGALDVEAGNGIALDSVVSPDMRLVSTSEEGAVTVGEAVMRHAVLRGGTVRLTGRHDGGEGRLTLDVETSGGNASDVACLNLKSAPGVEITNLQAVDADIRVASDDLSLASARILKRGDIRNDFNHVITDNGNLAPQACTLQLYPEEKRFSAHLKKAFDVTTSARAVNYDDNFITNDFSTENSMVRQAEKEMARVAAPEPKKQGAPKQLSVGPVAAAVPVMAAPLSLPVDASPVALGDEGLGADETFEVVAP